MKWCIPKKEVSDAALQGNIDFACGSGVDCSPIQGGAACTLRSRAAYVMNAYYQSNGRTATACDFSGTGALTTVDPSKHSNLN